jgi:predicted 3-demethylubiquinone-9 3-methyltransferase (glyoxalase superfamily)
MQQKIVPNLWFDGQAEEAANFYVSVFKDGKVLTKADYPEDSPGEPGTTMVVEWELMGQRFVGINGGSQFKFDEAVSFQITCEDQEEIDYYWEALTADGGSEGPCGWLKDKFGLSWQVTPKGMDDVFSDPDKERASRAMQAMMKMKKLDIAELQAAADGVPAGSAS